jgi:hypothetical protein
MLAVLQSQDDREVHEAYIVYSMQHLSTHLVRWVDIISFAVLHCRLWDKNMLYFLRTTYALLKMYHHAIVKCVEMLNYLIYLIRYYPKAMSTWNSKIFIKHWVCYRVANDIALEIIASTRKD